MVVFIIYFTGRIDLADIGIVDYKSFNEYKNVVFKNFLFALKFFCML